MTGRTDSSALLRAPGVAAALLGTAPAWLWDTRNGRILLASSAGIAFFGAETLAALKAREFDSSRPEYAQLTRIARTLPRDGSSRLSLLRLFVGFRDMSVPCQCRMVGGRGEGLMLVAAASGGSKDDIAARAAALLDGLSDPAILRGESGEIWRNAAAPDEAESGGPAKSGGRPVSVALPEGAFELVLFGSGLDEGEPVPAGDTGAARGAQFDASAAEAAGGAGSAGASRAGASRPSRVLPETRRFTFLLDPDGRFVEVGAGFAALVGPQSADVIGKSWQELDDELHFDPDGALADALETRDTWSDVRLDWPTDYGERAALRLSALPRYGEGHAFAGYRGFADLLDVVPVEGDTPDATTPDVDTPDPDTADAETGETSETRTAVRSERAAEQSDAGAEHQPRSSSVAELPVLESERPKKGKRSRAADRSEEKQHREEERADAKIHHLHTAPAAPRQSPAGENGSLNDQERSAFKAIAAALGARWQDEVSEDEDGGTKSGGRARNARTLSADASDDAPAANEAMRDDTADDDAFEGAPDAAIGLSGRGTESEVEWPRGPLSVFPEHSLPESGSLDSLLQDVLDRVPLGLAVLRDERLLMANRAFLDLFDYPDLDALESAGGLGVALEGQGETDTGPATAVVARRRDGSPVSVNARLGRTPWIDGPAMLMSVREATGDAFMEQKLSAADLKAVVDAALDGVIVLDADAKIVSANGGAERLLGIDEADLAGESFLEIIAEDGREAAAEMLANLAASVPTLVEKGLSVTLIGADDPVEATLTMARLGTREPARFCAVIRDMTDWNEAEADLVAARKRAEAESSQKSDFLAKMSHEIRTPLNGIIGFSEIMLEERFGPFGNDRYRDYIRDIRESGEHLMSLVNDLLDLSKVEAGKLDLSFTGVKLNDLAEQSVAIMQPQASKARVIVRTNLWPTLPAVVADVRSVRQVLLNLLSNAIKFTPPGGQVIVSTVLGESGDVFVRVRDTGPGMSESDVAVALEPFRQLPVTPTGGERGTGLGLPLAKALVEANRASFSLQSKVGDGTLVEICFPQNRVLSE